MEISTGVLRSRAISIRITDQHKPDRSVKPNRKTAAVIGNGERAEENDEGGHEIDFRPAAGLGSP